MARRGPGEAVEERAFLDIGAPIPPDATPQETVSRPAILSVPEVRARIAGRQLNVASRLAARLRDDWTLEADRGALFLLLPVVICAGALLYFALPAEPGLATILLAGCIAGAALKLAATRQLARLAALATLALVAGIALARFETMRLDTRIVGGEIATRITGRVVAVEQRDGGRVRLTIDVLETRRPTLRYQPDRVRLTARTPQGEIRAGDVVEGLARLTPPLGPLRPGSYDFAFQAYFDGIGAAGYFLQGPARIVWPDTGSSVQAFLAWVERQRMAVAARIRGHVAGPEGEIAAALVAGVRAGIPDAANEALRITGLAHILSISGLHMALVAGVVIGATRAGFALFPGFASRHAVRKYAAVAALGALTLYLLISGAAVAAQRSYIMIVIMLLALLADRAAITMRNLAIAALLILVVSPHEAAGPSFQMSFAATAALISAYAWWSERRAARPPTFARMSGGRRAGRMLAAAVVGLAATSVVAGLASGIYGAWHFQRVAPLGLVANLAVMPIVSLLVMPAAVLGTVLVPFGLEGLPFAAMGQGLRWVLAIAEWLAGYTPVDAIGSVSGRAIVLLSLGLVPLTLATTTSWRLVAVPFLLFGAASMAMHRAPIGYISEDGRLIGVAVDGGRVAVSLARPSAFTVADWQRALRAETVQKPEKASQNKTFLLEPDSALECGDSNCEAGVANGSGQMRSAAAVPTAASHGGFACDRDLCLLRLNGGPVIAHAQTMPAAERACSVADLIAIADATAANPCPGTAVRVVTARHLALRGGAALRSGAGGGVDLLHAFGEDLRPWHDHRRFSRAARGLAPWQPAAASGQRAAATGGPAGSPALERPAGATPAP